MSVYRICHARQCLRQEHSQAQMCSWSHLVCVHWVVIYFHVHVVVHVVLVCYGVHDSDRKTLPIVCLDLTLANHEVPTRESGDVFGPLNGATSDATEDGRITNQSLPFSPTVANERVLKASECTDLRIHQHAVQHMNETPALHRPSKYHYKKQRT